MGLRQSRGSSPEIPDHYFQDQFPPLVEQGAGAGKTVAITGCTTGLGLELAMTAIKVGAKKVIMLNRPSGRVAAAKERLDAVVAEASGGGDGAAAETKPSVEVVVINCDLTSFASVREACKQVTANVGADGLDVLCCNAGIMTLPAKATEDGFDIQIQVNHLSHFLMVRELLPCLEAAAAKRGEARIVNHSSSARFTGGVALETRFFQPFTSAAELGGDATGFSGGCYARYHQSKLANSAFTMALHDKLQEKGSKVKALVAEPGLTASDLWKDGQYSRAGNAAINCYKQNVRDGSLPLTMACFGPSAKSGDFFAPALYSRILGAYYAGPAHAIFEGGIPLDAGREHLTADKAGHRLLWEASEKACGALLS